GLDGQDGRDGTDGRDGRDAINQLSLVGDTFYLDGFSLGITIDDCVKMNFSQKGNQLEGDLDLSIIFYDYFDKITYTINRTGATIGTTTYVDTIVPVSDLSTNRLQQTITAGYHGNYVLYVNFYDEENNLIHTTSKPVNFKAEHYNIYYLNATLPVLLATTQLYTEPHKGVTYMGLDRRATYNWYELPANTYGFPNTTVSDGTTNLGLFNDQGIEKTTIYGNQAAGTWGGIAQTGNPNHAIHTKKWIADLYAMDNSSTFTFACVDNSAGSAIAFGYGNSIPKANFNIKIYTDGTSTTSIMNSRNLNTYSKWVTVRNEYLEFINNAASMETINIFNYKSYPYVMCVDNNVEYIVNCKPAMLNSVQTKNAENASLLYDIYDDHITQLSVGDAFDKVRNVGKIKELEFLLRTRWVDNENVEGSAAQYFNTGNGKPSLMILGTSESAENGNNVGATFLDLFQFVIDTYGDEYNILYKGHPAWPLSRFEDGDDRKTFFESNNILILPNATPAETFMYLYENVYIGGYFSTTFTSAMIGQTIFFFGSESAIKGQGSIAHMFNTEDPDYMGVFENAVFIDKNYIETHS
ncbi:MAG TPA: hypothetical protein PLW76_07545, partial [Clostridia bacterium]|nr:hypothetical protein [Clostridia bacterium]